MVARVGAGVGLVARMSVYLATYLPEVSDRGVERIGLDCTYVLCKGPSCSSKGRMMAMITMTMTIERL
jgi:hypothetical protein